MPAKYAAIKRKSLAEDAQRKPGQAPVTGPHKKKRRKKRPSGGGLLSAHRDPMY